MIGHNLFSFDFKKKGLRLSSWRTTNLAIGRKHLTSINYANIAYQVYWHCQVLSTEFIHPFQQYERWGKKRSENRIRQFYRKRSKTTWKVFCVRWNRQRMDFGLFVIRKGVITYETIPRPESLDIAPEKDIFFYLIIFDVV